MRANRLKHAFTFGKFLPFHKGHEAMVRFALAHSEMVTVIACASDKERIPVAQRCRWIRETFADDPRLHVIPFEFREEVLPNTSVASRDISRLWSRAFAPLVQGCDGVVTSEAYGDFVAQELGIEHVVFDMAREQCAVSASKVNAQPQKYWNYLPDAVKTDLAFTVVILGTESTGKTTLTQNLAKHYGATAVYEAGRDLVESSDAFDFALLPLVAQTHAGMMLEGKRGDCPLVVVDTDVHITASYARFCFERDLTIEPDVRAANRANLYLYLDKDAPFVQDGTRMDEARRNLLDASHRQMLHENNVPYVLIQGDWEERFKQACSLIDAAFEAYFPWRMRLTDEVI